MLLEQQVTKEMYYNSPFLHKEQYLHGNCNEITIDLLFIKIKPVVKALNKI